MQNEEKFQLINDYEIFEKFFIVGPNSNELY